MLPVHAPTEKHNLREGSHRIGRNDAVHSSLAASAYQLVIAPRSQASFNAFALRFHASRASFEFFDFTPSVLPPCISAIMILTKSARLAQFS
jgi:hypothetical protein